jgi:hypothetical protein
MKNQLINKDFDAAYILGKAGEKAATNVQG